MVRAYTIFHWGKLSFKRQLSKLNYLNPSVLMTSIEKYRSYDPREAQFTVFPFPGCSRTPSKPYTAPTHRNMAVLTGNDEHCSGRALVTIDDMPSAGDALQFRSHMHILDI